MGSSAGKILEVAAPIAAIIVAPYLAPAIGAATGLGVAGATALGAAGISAGGELLGGAGLKNAAIAGIGSGIGGFVSGAGGLANAAQDVGLGTVGHTLAAGVSGPVSQASGLAGFLGNNVSSGSGLGSGLLTAAGNIYSGIQGTDAAKEIAAQQATANANALALQSKVYNQTLANEQPFLTSGTAANQQLANLLGISGNTATDGYGSLVAPFDASDLQNTPGYQFQLQQGTKAMNQTLGAQGGLFSGQALKQAQQFGQGLADQTYNDAYNRYLQTNQQTYNQLAGQAASGQNAAANLGGVGQNYANTQTTGLENSGNIAANSTNAQNTAVNQGLAGLLNGTYGYTGGGQSSYSSGVNGVPYTYDAQGKRYLNGVPA